MKQYHFILPSTVCIFIVYVLTACMGMGQQNRIKYIIPDPTQDHHQELIDPFVSWQIIETKTGPGNTGIPEWVRQYYNNRYQGLESLTPFRGKYMFAGENRGDSITSLDQWVNGFTAEHDFPRLVAARVERRLVSSASLYPDDEYGQFFESLIKAVADGEFPGAVRDQAFWIKRNVIVPNEDFDPDEDDPEMAEFGFERYEYLVLIGINKDILEKQLRDIMSGIRTTVPPTREQAAKIAGIQQTFFEGF
jgi:hypothetical protein